MLESQGKMQGQEMVEIHTDKQIPIHTLRENLKSALSSIVNTPIINKNDGRVAILSNKGVAKMYSNASVQKSIANGFTQEEHIEASKYIQSLYENASHISQATDRSGDKSLIIHRYEAKIQANGKQARAKITLKETMKDGNRIYTLELQELE